MKPAIEQLMDGSVESNEDDENPAYGQVPATTDETLETEANKDKDDMYA